MIPIAPKCSFISDSVVSTVIPHTKIVSSCTTILAFVSAPTKINNIDINIKYLHLFITLLIEGQNILLKIKFKTSFGGGIGEKGKAIAWQIELQSSSDSTKLNFLAH